MQRGKISKGGFITKLYENIKNRRKELGMTQTELAHRLGYSDRSAVAHIEKGDIDLPQSKIVAFAEALSTTPGELLGEVESDISPKLELILSKLERLTPAQLAIVENLIDEFLN